MSNNYWEDEEDDLDTNDGLEGNDLVKKLRKAKRSDEKRIKELSEQLEGFLKEKKESTVRQVLEKKAKAARLIMKDLDDVNEETVNGWLDENADLFGIKVADAPEVDKGNLAALRNQDVLTQGAVTPDKAQDFEARLNNASSADEILSLLRSQE